MKIFRAGFGSDKNHERRIHSHCRDFDAEKEKCRKDAERRCETAKQFLCSCHSLNGLLR